MKFTKEIKEKWLNALKSGNYKQGFCQLYTSHDNSYCCLGVLGKINPELFGNDFYSGPGQSPYQFLRKNGIDPKNLWEVNDNETNRPKNRDYSNVIPLIEQLPTND